MIPVWSARTGLALGLLVALPAAIHSFRRSHAPEVSKTPGVGLRPRGEGGIRHYELASGARGSATREGAKNEA